VVVIFLIINQPSESFSLFSQLTQKQLQSATVLQRQLSSITPETAAGLGSRSSQQEDIETSLPPTSDRLDVKGKSPVGTKDEEIIPSSSDEVPTNTRVHDLASLLTVQEQGLVTSPSVHAEEREDITRRNHTSSEEPDIDGMQSGHDNS
jgi:hypothetical protein